MKNVVTVYHGSKNGLDGPIRMVSGRNRQACDFGQGFRDLVRRYAGKEAGR